VIKPRSLFVGNGLFEPHFDDEQSVEGNTEAKGRTVRACLAFQRESPYLDKTLVLGWNSR
jgi:hypothetical protein